MAFSTHDAVSTSPTNVFATLNPLFNDSSNNTFSEANLKIAMGSSYHTVVSTIGVSSGKWFFEHLGNTQVGVVESEFNSTSRFGYATSPYNVAYNHYTGEIIVNNSIVATVNTYGSGDIVGCFLDFDNQQIKFYKNGTLQSYTVSFTASGGFYHFAVGHATVNAHVNFGQDHLFGGATLPSGAGSNTPDNGIGTFAFSVPSGAKSLCTKNIQSNLAIDPNKDDLPEDFFKCTLYSGSTSNLNHDTGLKADLVWIKKRSGVERHVLVDSVRGGNSTSNFLLYPDMAVAQEYDNVNNHNWLTLTSSSTSNSLLTAKGSTGMTNEDGHNYVCWAWRAGGSPSGATSATGSAKRINSTGTQDDTSCSALASAATSAGASNVITPTLMSINQKSGFSIIKYTGTGSAASVPHGLLSAPEMILCKTLEQSIQWVVYHKSTGPDGFLGLNTSDAFNSGDSDYWGSGTGVTDTVFGLQNAAGGNNHASDLIAYCWHSVPGFSAFGSYTGNGSANGPFIYTGGGFKPAWLMVKRTDSANSWIISDNARNPYNVVNINLLANSADADNTNAGFFDFLSNGFKLQNADGGVNASGGTYIYMAWAEMPFKYAATNAR